MADRKPTLCVVAGPNGSGKTTTTIQLLQDEWTANSLYINPDNSAQETFGDWNSSEAVLKAAEQATKLRYECLEKRCDFVFETVFSSSEKLEFLKKAKDRNLHCVKICDTIISKGICRERSDLPRMKQMRKTL